MAQQSRGPLEGFRCLPCRGRILHEAEELSLAAGGVEPLAEVSETDESAAVFAAILSLEGGPATARVARVLREVASQARLGEDRFGDAPAVYDFDHLSRRVVAEDGRVFGVHVDELASERRLKHPDGSVLD